MLMSLLKMCCLCIDNYGGNSSYSIDGYVDDNECFSTEEQHGGESAVILGERYWLRHWVDNVQLGH